MMVKFVIPGEFPAMNEIVAASKSHFGAYSGMKKKYTGKVIDYVINHGMLKNPVEVTIYWYTKDWKKDPDNVSAGIKFILDGLKEGGVIENDTRKIIKGINHKFPDPDKGNPRVEIYLTEVIVNGEEQQPKETKKASSRCKQNT